MPNLLDKEEIRIAWKKISKKIRTSSKDDELIGSPNFLIMSPENTPLIMGGENDITALGALTAKQVVNTLNNREKEKLDRINRYKQHQQVQEHPEIEGVLNIYSDEAITEDKDGVIIHVIHPNQNIQKIVEDLFDRVDINNKVWQIAWNICGFGDDFWEVVPNQSLNSVLQLNFIPRENIERIEENGVLRGFKAINVPTELKTSFSAYRHYDYRMQKNRDKDDEEMIHSWRILHFKSQSSKYGVYGKSVVDSVIALIDLLKLMEKSLMIARVMRAPERRVFMIDVGQLQGEKAIKYAYDAVNYFKKKKKLDLLGNKSPEVLNDIFSDVEDIILPKRAGAENNAIDTLPQIASTDTEDLNFLRDKIFPAVGIPRQYLFDDTFANANTNLSSKSVAFSKRIRRVQRFIIQQLYKLAIIELKLKGYGNYVINDLQIMMNNPSNIDENERITNETNIWNLIGSIRGQNADTIFYPDYLIYKDILRKSDDEIVEIYKLSQLQKSGENVFNAFPTEERPEGYKDLANAPAAQPGEEGGAPGGGGGGGVPAEAEAALGPAPEGGEEEGGGGEEASPEAEAASAVLSDVKIPTEGKFSINEVLEKKKKLLKNILESTNYDNSENNPKKKYVSIKPIVVLETMDINGELEGLEKDKKYVITFLETEEKK